MARPASRPAENPPERGGANYARFMQTRGALEFVEVRAEDDRRWGLFGDDDRYELGWSELQPVPFEKEADRFFEIHSDGEEVARLHLDWRTDFTTAWRGAPVLGLQALRIQMVEVACEARGRGIGRAIIHGVQEQYPDSRLIALSVREAESFWSSLGWERFEHAKDRFYQRLFVGPLPRSRRTLR